MIIKPTIGRVVWYWPLGVDPNDDQPFPALICFVHNDQCINVAGFTHEGLPIRAASVYLAQEDEPIPANGGYAAWMPYQVGQAKKHAADEKQIEACSRETASIGLEQGDAAAAAVQKPGTQRVSLADMRARIVRESYDNPDMAPHVTRCLLMIDNGYVFEGISAPADPANFDEALGRKFAYEDALRKLWPIMGFMLCENIYRQKQMAGAGLVGGAIGTFVKEKPDTGLMSAEEQRAYQQQKAAERDLKAKMAAQEAKFAADQASPHPALKAIEDKPN